MPYRANALRNYLRLEDTSKVRLSPLGRRSYISLAFLARLLNTSQTSKSFTKSQRQRRDADTIGHRHVDAGLGARVYGRPVCPSHLVLCRAIFRKTLRFSSQAYIEPLNSQSMS